MFNIAIDIEVKRQEMMLLADKHGLNASETVKCSQELDCLLNQLQEDEEINVSTQHAFAYN